jgi:glycosyltransferase involved in cell wall biosynthesis
VRVLHVWNTAGVASVIAKFMDRFCGTESDVMARALFDPVGLTTYGRTYQDGPLVFLLRAFFRARKYDLVHVHSLDRLVPWLDRFYGSKPLVLLYHGTEILGRWEEKKPRWKHADALAYSTPNLSQGAPGSAFLMPNPVDTDLFSPHPENRRPGTAISIRYGMDEEAERVAKSMSLELSWIDRGSISHREMPTLLSKFEYFLDLRRPVGFAAPVESVGKAALEALACGCKVVDWSGKIIQGLPDVHRPDVVAKEWYSIYKKLEGAS